MSAFGEAIAGAYAVEGATLELGRGVHDGAVCAEAAVRVPLAMTNRHGLIAGATGTRTDAESARELLAARLEAARLEAASEPPPTAGPEPAHIPLPKPRRAPRAPRGAPDALGDFLTSREGKALQRKVARGVLGMLRKRL